MSSVLVSPMPWLYKFRSIPWWRTLSLCTTWMTLGTRMERMKESCQEPPLWIWPPAGRWVRLRLCAGCSWGSCRPRDVRAGGLPRSLLPKAHACYFFKKVCLSRAVFILKSLSVKDLGQQSSECKSICPIRSELDERHEIHATGYPLWTHTTVAPISVSEARINVTVGLNFGKWFLNMKRNGDSSEDLHKCKQSKQP